MARRPLADAVAKPCDRYASVSSGGVKRCEVGEQHEQFADGQPRPAANAAAEHLHAADAHDGCRAQRQHEARRDLELQLRSDRPQVRRDGSRRQGSESPVFEFFSREGLDDGDGRQRLLRQREHLAFELLLRVTSFRHRPGEELDQDAHRYRRRQRQDSQPAVDLPHDREHDGERDERHD